MTFPLTQNNKEIIKKTQTQNTKPNSMKINTVVPLV